jgi:aromatic-L-amino-acid decarboxylase
MDNQSFREWAARAVDWAADYRASLAQQPVRAQTAPGATAAQIPTQAPEAPEEMRAIFADFERIILPGMTHWQHPRFFAYFPANASPVSVIAEILVSAMAAQCMLWQTSPAATELETVMMQWLRHAVGLPDAFQGVIQDSASSATLAAVLTMRERTLGFAGNKNGLAVHPKVRIYASDQTHSSIDKRRFGLPASATTISSRCRPADRPVPWTWTRWRQPSRMIGHQVCCRPAS